MSASPPVSPPLSPPLSTLSAPSGALALGTPLIAAQALAVGRKGRAVLEHVDFTVNAGEIVTLVGPNGAGKSTLVQTLLGLLAPLGGGVERRPGLRVGYMPQRLSIDATLPLTVRRLLTLWGPVAGDDLERVVGLAGVAPLLKRPVQGLSGGEWQRVLLARALLRRPDLLVLDEPAQSLDRGGQDGLYRLIDTLRRPDGGGLGVLMVCHDLAPVLRLSDRVVVVDGGVRFVGPPDQAVRHPDFAALFGLFGLDGAALGGFLAGEGPRHG